MGNFVGCLDVLRLSWQETRQVFEKLHTYIGKNIKNLVDRPDEDYVLRLHKNRVYYVRESLMRKATNVSQLWPFRCANASIPLDANLTG